MFINAARQVENFPQQLLHAPSATELLEHHLFTDPIPVIIGGVASVVILLSFELFKTNELPGLL